MGEIKKASKLEQKLTIKTVLVHIAKPRRRIDVCARVCSKRRRGWTGSRRVVFSQAGYRSVAVNLAKSLEQHADVLNKCLQEHGCFDMLGSLEMVGGPQVRADSCSRPITPLCYPSMCLYVPIYLHSARCHSGERGGYSRGFRGRFTGDLDLTNNSHTHKHTHIQTHTQTHTNTHTHIYT